jgi:hypothetical protein
VAAPGHPPLRVPRYPTSDSATTSGMISITECYQHYRLEPKVNDSDADGDTVRILHTEEGPWHRLRGN